MLINAQPLLNALKNKNLKIVTAESCTGGLFAASLTDVAGSSSIFEHGYVTYSNASKTKLLQVPATLLEDHGAVSAECAAAMAIGALDGRENFIALSITGIAGPSGGSPDKPVGLVYIGLAHAKIIQSQKNLFSGTRQDIRHAALLKAQEIILDYLKTL